MKWCPAISCSVRSVWNSLTVYLRDIGLLADGAETMGQHVKTFLFASHRLGTVAYSICYDNALYESTSTFDV